jgi:hypothetical protein
LKLQNLFYCATEDLPEGLTLKKVYTDYISGLMAHTKRRIVNLTGESENLWGKYAPTAEVILAHPNRWRQRQRDLLKEAAIDSGLITAGRAATGLKFVEEAEAAARYSVSTHSNIFATVPLMVCSFLYSLWVL